MNRILIKWDIKLTIFTILCPLATTVLVFLQFSYSKLFLAELAWCFFMEFLFMLFLTVNIIHLTTIFTLFYVTATVTEVGSNFRFRKLFETILTGLHWLAHESQKYSKYYYQKYTRYLNYNC